MMKLLTFISIVSYSCLFVPVYQGVTQRCRLSWLTNSAPVYEPKCGGKGRVAGSQPMSTAVHMEPKINFGDLTPYLTFGRYWPLSAAVDVSLHDVNNGLHRDPGRQLDTFSYNPEKRNILLKQSFSKWFFKSIRSHIKILMDLWSFGHIFPPTTLVLSYKYAYSHVNWR